MLRTRSLLRSFLRFRVSPDYIFILIKDKETHISD
nr:MAG TPA: hypothetical protein [Caudoviricetes sp.]